jgi:hypothetical protein
MDQSSESELSSSSPEEPPSSSDDEEVSSREEEEEESSQEEKEEESSQEEEEEEESAQEEEEEEEEEESSQEEEEEAEASTSRKRKPTEEIGSSVKKTKKPNPRQKALTFGIDLNTVRSYPQVTYLRQCIGKINQLLDRSQWLSRKGSKAELLCTIFDFLGVSEDERKMVPVSPMTQRYIDATKFAENDFGYKRGRNWIEDTKDGSSIKSFDDCGCSKCRCKQRQPPGDRNITALPIPPNIPSIKSIEDAIQQVSDGTIPKMAQLYRRTKHWPKLCKRYSERNILYTDYQRHGSDLQRLLEFHFGDSQKKRTYKLLIKKIGQWNVKNR